MRGILLNRILPVLTALFALAAGEAEATMFVTPGGNDSVIDTVYDDDVFLAGNIIRFDGKVRGDLYTSCYELVQSDTVEGNLISFSRTVQSLGPVGRSFIGFAQYVTCNASVGRNLIGFAQNISVGPDVVVGLDADLFAGTVVFQGEAGRNLKIRSDHAVFSGKVRGNLDFQGDLLTISPEAVIEGDLIYCSPEAAEIGNTNSIKGEVIPTKCEKKERGGISFGKLFMWLASHRGYFLTLTFFSLVFFVFSAIPFPAGLALVFLIASLLVCGNLFIMLSKDLSARTERTLRNRTFPSLGTGFAIMILSPIVAVVLILSILGAPLGGVFLLVMGVAFFAGGVYATGFIGREVCMALKLGSPGSAGYLGYSIGIVLIVVLSFLPVIGYLITLLVIMMGLGGLALAIYSGEENPRSPLQEQ